MPENRLYPPEGLCRCGTYTLEDLYDAKENHTILEGIPFRCDAEHHLHFSLGGISARLPRQETVAPWISGSDRDISAISRVGKPTCFTVESIEADEKGAPIIYLNRRVVQEQAMDWFLEGGK